jgi:hypothetical protein
VLVLVGAGGGVGGCKTILVLPERVPIYWRRGDILRRVG